jgi:ABC-type nitrate/sulfonate/bicarbonate transport system substrate-binding protein
MSIITLALDWTPNINHIGFFIAQAKGYYSEHDLQVTITDPREDNYAITPAKKVELGLADFALCPTESVISYRTKSVPFNLKAVAAILQQDLSAIVVKTSSNIVTPKDLDHTLYASYEAKYEDEIVRQMIRNDGGQGDIKISYPDKLEIWEHLLDNRADSTWIFLNWEGVSINNSKYDMRYFKLEDYNIPYSYSPVLVADEALITTKKDAYRQFLHATEQGFMFACKHPEEAVDIFAQFVPKQDANIDLKKALTASSSAFTEKGRWGLMDEKKVSAFLDWLRLRSLEIAPFTAADICTNELLNVFDTKSIH